MIMQFCVWLQFCSAKQFPWEVILADRENLSNCTDVCNHDSVSSLLWLEARATVQGGETVAGRGRLPATVIAARESAFITFHHMDFAFNNTTLKLLLSGYRYWCQLRTLVGATTVIILVMHQLSFSAGLTTSFFLNSEDPNCSLLRVRN